MSGDKKLMRVIAAAVCLSAFTCACGCEENNGTDVEPYSENGEIDDEYTGNGVCFTDVGAGDCSLIKTDDFSLLIDCGNDGKQVKENLFNILDSKVKSGIDYFILSHPDEEHIGNAEEIISRYNCRNLLVPFTDYEYSESYVKAVNSAREKGVTIKEFNYLTEINGKNSDVFFLYPEHKYSDEFNDISVTEMPSEKLLDEISPVIYLEIDGIRIILCTDASYKQENKVLNNFKSGLYDAFFGKGEVDLYDVDLLKISGHGRGDATSEDFLQVLNPDNAVISCGAANPPNTETLKRLYKRNGKTSLFRTDLNGNVTVKIDNGKLTVSTSMK